jgi:2-amino-4-hydroxy-6-hydroxymethyldihydropteridine diphosphokinase
MINRVFVGIGSNLGDRLGQLCQAARLLDEAGCKLLQSSSIYATAAWGKLDQPDFLNAVLELQWAGEPMQLLHLAMEVEAKLGRERHELWGPRSLDVDLLAIGELQLHSQRLSLPHPYIPQRAFVLVPWAEIAPDFHMKPWEKTVLEMRDSLPEEDRAGVRLAHPPISLD